MAGYFRFDQRSLPVVSWSITLKPLRCLARDYPLDRSMEA